jgi:hypothetical protein
VLPLVTAIVEGNIYQNQVLLAPPEPEDAGGRQDGPFEPPISAAPASPAPRVQNSPDLAPGWRFLANLDAAKAIAVFEPRCTATDPAVSREALFGRGVALLDLQPVSAGQIAQARRIFAGLADGGGDDIAAGARFLLGRIAQDHQDVPDAAEAGRQYRRLLSEHPDSVWAQTALTRLAMLEIYASGTGLPPAERIARAEKLLSRARVPSAASDLHIALATGIFFYRLPAGGALPHLLAAARLGRLDWTTRTDTLVQVAELSRLAGDTRQAALYYRLFLKENPIDLRCYIVRERLAAVEKKG